MDTPPPNKAELLGDALELIYDEYEQALTLQDQLIAAYPEEGDVIDELKLRLNFDIARKAAEKVDFTKEPSESDVDAVFNFGNCVTVMLEYCRTTSEELSKV